MESNWAAEHLQTIRTLMERSALYRHALAPISVFLGVMGTAAAYIGWHWKIETVKAFAIYWMAVSAVGVVGALFLVRRQALRQAENFWSPPTRRIAQAILPALLVGLIAGLISAARFQGNAVGVSFSLVIAWTIFYGLALHAAGFFMPRGIRLFGWGFLLAGLAMLNLMFWTDAFEQNISPHWLMGGIFGGAHLAHGIYLYFTEKRGNET